MRIAPLTALRLATVALGAAAGPLLVRALDQGLAGEPRPLTFVHFLLGVLVAAVVMPGPFLGMVVDPDSGEKPRGLAVGGSAVTAFVALLSAGLLWGRIFVRRDAGLPEVLAFSWAVLALPLAILDFVRLRRGAGVEGNDRR